MISVLIATAGQRGTLHRAVRSALVQLTDADELLIVADGIEAQRRVHHMGLPASVVKDGPHGDWGHTVRNRSIPQLRRPWVVHLDDDDTLAPDALIRVRLHVAEHPESVHLYRILYEDGHYLWTHKGAIQGNVGTSFIVHRRYHAGTFGSYYGSDAEFVQGTIAKSGCDPIWHEEYLTHVRH